MKNRIGKSLVVFTFELTWCIQGVNYIIILVFLITLPFFSDTGVFAGVQIVARQSSV